MASSCAPDKIQLTWRFLSHVVTLGPERAWVPLAVVPRRLPSRYLVSFLALFYLHVRVPLDAQKYLEPVTNLVLLIMDTLLMSTVSQHIVLAQKMLIQVDKWAFHSATQEVAVDSNLVHLELRAYDLFTPHWVLSGCP